MIYSLQKGFRGHAISCWNLDKINNIKRKIGGCNFLRQGTNINQHIYFVLRHEQFSYLTETFMRTQYDDPQGPSMSEVKIEDNENI